MQVMLKGKVFRVQILTSTFMLKGELISGKLLHYKSENEISQQERGLHGYTHVGLTCRPTSKQGPKGNYRRCQSVRVLSGSDVKCQGALSMKT